MPREPAHIAREYVEAVGDKELGKVEALLAPNVVPRARGRSRSLRSDSSRGRQ